MTLTGDVRIKVFIATVITVAFVLLVEYWLDWWSILAPWSRQSPVSILLACCLMLLTYWMRSMRLYDYFHVELRGRFLDCLGITLTHNFFNNLLPMRAGEVSFPILMRARFAMSPARSTASLLWFRLMDLHVLGLFAVSAIGAYLWEPIITLALVTAWLSVAPVLYLFGDMLQHRFTSQPDSRTARTFGLALGGLPHSWAGFLRAWCWTFANWLVKLSIFVWVLLLFIEAPAPGAWLAVITGDLTSVLPVHGFAGTGTYEAGVVGGLTPFGIEARAALAAAINLHIFVLASTLAGGAVGILIGAFRASGSRHAS